MLYCHDILAYTCLLIRVCQRRSRSILNSSKIRLISRINGSFSPLHWLSLLDIYLYSQPVKYFINIIPLAHIPAQFWLTY